MFRTTRDIRFDRFCEASLIPSPFTLPKGSPAVSVADAWREARRSTDNPTDLQVWNGREYVIARATAQ